MVVPDQKMRLHCDFLSAFLTFVYNLEVVKAPHSFTRGTVRNLTCATRALRNSTLTEF